MSLHVMVASQYLVLNLHLYGYLVAHVIAPINRTRLPVGTAAVEDDPWEALCNSTAQVGPPKRL
jgi:hypothetical protein